MTEAVNFSFCDKCVFRGQVINGDYCAMSGLDNMNRLLGGVASTEVLTLDAAGGRISTAAEVSMLLGSEYMLEVGRCIEQVQAGGEPLPAQEF